jgi:hypothetical protein
VRLVLSKGPNRVGVSLPLPEIENIRSFRNVVFSRYLELRTFDKVYKGTCAVSFSLEPDCARIVRFLEAVLISVNKALLCAVSWHVASGSQLCSVQTDHITCYSSIDCL